MSRKTDSVCPQVVLDWIAWYPDGDLPADVRSEIEVHAAECAACRDEIVGLSSDVPLEADADPAGESVFERTLAKIAVHPQRSAPPRQRRIWVMRPRFAIAAGLAVAIVSGTGGFVATQQLGNAERYETASLPPGAARPSAGPHLAVVFRGDVPFAEISSALQALGATVESGPSPRGVVQLQLARGSDPAAAARRLESGDLDVADFAQPAP
ncbi:MAG TPA: zf-HC2 domain-containing protein [Myxococcota bacterium]|jgi:anti-sigma factor RsiW